ncbi:MAG: hypothetical protein B7C24_10085 [Bacteroidetes bacterium 4572_77]|nr:MAG: hypothetical protein B7C24_10085 [Bacteroidetes bacterium 4572_77]
MRGVTRQIDSCKGRVLDTINSSVYANGSLIAVCGATIAPHKPCPRVQVHCAAKVITCSSHTFASGIGMAREGDK